MVVDFEPHLMLISTRKFFKDNQIAQACKASVIFSL